VLLDCIVFNASDVDKKVKPYLDMIKERLWAAKVLQ